MGRDKYGNYVNDQGVTIKVHEDKNGNDHIDFYDKPVDEDHSAVHVNVNYGNESWSTETHGPDHSDSENSSGGCYLTSACMKRYGKEFDDDCYELRILRWFRDNFVSKEDVDYYYSVAPKIVSKIDSMPNSNSIYEDIYNKVIKICVKAIEQKEYNMAYQIYKNNVVDYEQKYCCS